MGKCVLIRVETIYCTCQNSCSGLVISILPEIEEYDEK